MRNAAATAGFPSESNEDIDKKITLFMAIEAMEKDGVLPEDTSAIDNAIVNFCVKHHVDQSKLLEMYQNTRGITAQEEAQQEAPQQSASASQPSGYLAAKLEPQEHGCDVKMEQADASTPDDPQPDDAVEDDQRAITFLSSPPRHSTRVLVR